MFEHCWKFVRLPGRCFKPAVYFLSLVSSLSLPSCLLLRTYFLSQVLPRAQYPSGTAGDQVTRIITKASSAPCRHLSLLFANSEPSSQESWCLRLIPAIRVRSAVGRINRLRLCLQMSAVHERLYASLVSFQNDYKQAVGASVGGSRRTFPVTLLTILTPASCDGSLCAFFSIDKDPSDVFKEKKLLHPA